MFASGGEGAEPKLYCSNDQAATSMGAFGLFFYPPSFAILVLPFALIPGDAGLWIWTIGVVLFLHIPIVIIILYAFNASNIQGWPITDWTTKWFGPAIHNGEMQDALVLSLDIPSPHPAFDVHGPDAAGKIEVHRSASCAMGGSVELGGD